ncbi:pilus assembly protein TadG-related protein [Gracilibacillus dipsosauri]|uniref:pilus assembly protein TadG-related protein n=1 Tax=Gracilibacillus dipsosauri TaxID=178340 RepID=UPI00240A47A1
MKWLNNERGAATFIMFSLFAGMILMGFIFFDLTSVFMERRMSQTGSDAAAIAAAQKAEEIYQEKVKERSEEITGDLKDEIERLKQEWREEWERMVEEASEDEDEEDSGSSVDVPSWSEFFEEKFTEWKEGVESTYDNRSMPGSMESYFRSSAIDYEIDINEAMRFFWSEEGLSDFICEKVLEEEGQMREAAQRFADLNGIENDISIVFPVEGDQFKVGIRTKSTINDTFVHTVNTDDLDVPADAVANIQEPRGIKIICN